MNELILVALVDTEKEASELSLILKIATVGLKFKMMGKDAHMRMKKGDFTNEPKSKKENKKGCGINAE